jgi:hypothetical protein
VSDQGEETPEDAHEGDDVAGQPHRQVALFHAQQYPPGSEGVAWDYFSPTAPMLDLQGVERVLVGCLGDFSGWKSWGFGPLPGRWTACEPRPRGSTDACAASQRKLLTMRAGAEGIGDLAGRTRLWRVCRASSPAVRGDKTPKTDTPKEFVPARRTGRARGMHSLSLWEFGVRGEG